MVQWYYVDGTERVGPVSILEIESLLNSNKLNDETYVWRKGFANWEKIKNVEELKKVDGQVVQDEIEVPTLIFSDIHKQDELFFIRTGKDRESFNVMIYGPYSFNEIEEAFNEKRISSRTLVFSPGMEDWKELGELDYFVNRLNNIEKTLSVKSIKPLYIYSKISNNKIAFLLKDINGYNLTLQSKCNIDNDIIFKGNIILGNKIIAKNVELKMLNNNKFDQETIVQLINTDKKLIELIEKSLNE